jgi:hypothetical protein
MKEIDPLMLAESCRKWQMTPNGAKTYIVHEAAETFGVSYQTMHRKFKKLIYKPEQRKESKIKGVSKIQGLKDIACAIAHLYALIPQRVKRKPSIEYTIEKAIINGLIPESAKDIHPGTITRKIREMNLLDSKGRVQRFQAQRPMEQVQYDVSGSEYLYVHRIEGNEPILRIRPDKGYKNKDKFENLRVWYHGLVDDHSRYWLAMPHVAPGESSNEAIKTLKWAFSKKADIRIPFRGLPSRIYMDNGPLAKAKATQEFLNRIGVEIKTHMPDDPEATGKIEIKWRSLWQMFEAGEFLMQPHWETQEIPLTQLREMLLNYTVRFNNRQHPNLKVSKLQAWLSIIQDGGVIDIAEEAFDTVFTYYDRQVKPDGTISIDGIQYFVKGLVNAYVRAYVGLLNRKIVAEDLITHKRYDVIPYVIPQLGEFKTDKQPAGVKIREEAQALKERFLPGEFKGVYQGRTDDKVISMPIRTKEERIIEDPLSLPDRYPSIQEAMKEFMSYLPGIFMSQENRGVIEEQIEEHGMNKVFVENFALEVRAQMSIRQAM